MNIYQLLKILNNKNKLHVIVHFYDCKCVKHCVSSLQSKLKISQSLISKVLGDLFEKEIIFFKREHKNKYYFINPIFKKEWHKILDPIIKNPQMKEYKCKCNLC